MTVASGKSGAHVRPRLPSPQLDRLFRPDAVARELPERGFRPAVTGHLGAMGVDEGVGEGPRSPEHRARPRAPVVPAACHLGGSPLTWLNAAPLEGTAETPVMSSSRSLPFFTLVALVACGDGPTESPPTSDTADAARPRDAGPGEATDGGPDGASDLGPDTGPDGGAASPDGGADAGPSNRPPRFSAGMARADVPENAAGPVFTVAATDPDGDAIRHALEGPDAQRLEIDERAGAVRFRTPPDFEAPADADADNVYRAEVVASDGAATARLDLRLAVTNVNDVRPVLTSSAGGAAQENVRATDYVATATDADGSAIRFEISGGADRGAFVLDARSGALGLAAPLDFEAPADADRDNRYEVEITADDGRSASSPLAVVIDLRDVNEAPVLTSAASSAAPENGTTTGYVARARDPEGTPVRFGLSGQDGAAAAIDARTGVLALTAPLDFEAPSDADRDGTLDLVVSATDGALTSTLALAVRVTNLDEPPTFSGTLTGTVAENARRTSARAGAVDPEGDPILYELSGPDSARLQLDGAGGILFRAAPDFERPEDADADNRYVARLTARAGQRSTTGTATVTVLDVDEAPVFGSAAATSVRENETRVGYRLAATDPEGGAVTFGIGGGADAAAFTLRGDRLAWAVAPDFERPTDANRDNDYQVELTASDGANTGRRLLTVTVLDVPRALTLDFPTEGAELGGVARTAVAGSIADATPADVRSVRVGGSAARLFAGRPLRFRVEVPVAAGPASLSADARFIGGGVASATVGVSNQALLVDAGGVAADRGVAYILDPNRGAVVRADLGTGDRTGITGPTRGAGIRFRSPDDMIVDSAQGRLLVADDARDAIVLVDLTTGNRTETGRRRDPGPDLELPKALALDAARNRVLVTDDFRDALIAVDLGTGAKTELSGPNVGSGPRLFTPYGVAYDPITARAWVAEDQSEAIVQVDVRSGARTVLSDRQNGTGPAFRTPRDVTLDGTRLLVIDEGNDTIVAVDRATGNRTVLASRTRGSGPNLRTPRALVLTSTRTALVADFTVGLVEADLVTGDRRVVSAPTSVGSGPDLRTAVDVELDAERGEVLFLDRVFARGGLLALDLETGRRRIISDRQNGSGPSLRGPERLALDGRRVFVTDRNEDAVFEIDLGTGARSVVTDRTTGAGPALSAPTGIAIDPGRNLAFVGDRTLGAIFSVDLANGQRARITGTGGALFAPYDVVVDGARLLVADAGPREAILAIDIATGAETVISSSDVSSGRGAGPNLEPLSLDLDPAGGQAWSIDEQTGALLRIDLSTGQRTLVSGVTGGASAGAGPPVLEPEAAAVDLPRRRAFAIANDLGYDAVLLIDLESGQRAVIAL